MKKDSKNNFEEITRLLVNLNKSINKYDLNSLSYGEKIILDILLREIILNIRNIKE